MGRKGKLHSKVEELALVLEDLFSSYNLSAEDVLNALEKRKQETLPLDAFNTKKLSSLEIIVKFLKENREKKYSEIASLLNRDHRTIWSTYSNSKKKHPETLKEKSSVLIPIAIFSDRKSSVLETLVTYLKKQGHSFSQIAVFLEKDYKTIYTSYRRSLSKREVLR